jgi:hypothetical protein
MLLTAGGDRLWKLILNLATGGKHGGLHQFDYFKNVYFAEVPYRVPSCGFDVWLRLRPLSAGGNADADAPGSSETRKQGLSDAVAKHAEFAIEAQSATDRNAPLIPFAKIRLDQEIDIDQEPLHFSPVAGRGFEPYGMLTTLREKVYRLNNYTEELAATQAMLYAGERKPASTIASAPQRWKCRMECAAPDYGDALENSYRFKRFCKTNGYSNLPLDGIWLRAPYLHNGSVPTLWDLLNPQAKRPTFYFRGGDEYDWKNLGFKSDSPIAPMELTTFATTRRNREIQMVRSSAQ